MASFTSFYFKKCRLTLVYFSTLESTRWVDPFRLVVIYAFVSSHTCKNPGIALALQSLHLWILYLRNQVSFVDNGSLPCHGNLRVPPPQCPPSPEKIAGLNSRLPLWVWYSWSQKISGHAAVSINRKGKVELKRPEEKLNDAGIWQFRLKGNGLKIWDPIAWMNHVLGFV